MSIQIRRLYEVTEEQISGLAEVGVVPDFALFPQGGYCGTTFFYKSLAAR